MVVGLDRRVTLGVVAHVDERLCRLGRDEMRSISALAPVCCLSTVIFVLVRATKGIADGVGAALGDRSEERLSSKSPPRRGSSDAGCIRRFHTYQSMLGLLPDGMEGSYPLSTRDLTSS